MQPPEKRVRKAEHEQTPKMTEEEKRKLVAANRAKAEARRTIRQVAQAWQAASASEAEEAG